MYEPSIIPFSRFRWNIVEWLNSRSAGIEDGIVSKDYDIQGGYGVAVPIRVYAER